MKKIKTRDDEQFGRLVAAIAEDMVTATLHWRLRMALHSAVNEFQLEFNHAPAFWGLTVSAHTDVSLWRLARLYDPTAGALSLPNYLATVRDNLANFDEGAFRKRQAGNKYVDTLAAHDRIPDSQQLKADIDLVREQTDPIVKKIVTFRHGHIGHRDARVPLGVLSLPGITAEEVSALLNRAREIVNRYNQLYNATMSSVQMVGEDDYLVVLKSMRSAIEAHEAAIDEEVAADERRNARSMFAALAAFCLKILRRAR